MIIAVTGATGFVGRHVLAELVATAHSVRALVRDPAKLANAPFLTVVRGDITDAAATAELCKGADVVLHVAGAISGGAADLIRINAEGTKILISSADRAGVKRFVHVSSLAARKPDLSPYGRSKAEGETHVRAAARTLQTLIVRPPAVYGEGDSATLPLLRALVAKTAVLPSTKAARFSLVHVQDMARILVAALTSEIEGLREVDDGHGAYTWEDVAAIMRSITGRPQRVLFLPRPVSMAAGHAADGVSMLMRRPFMISAGKMRELYFPDWVAAPPGWLRPDPVTLADGLRRTLSHAMARGLLQRLPLADRSAPT